MISGATSFPLHVGLPPLIQGPLLFKLYVKQSGPKVGNSFFSAKTFLYVEAELVF